MTSVTFGVSSDADLALAEEEEEEIQRRLSACARINR
jgi:hypothetical protein